MPKTLRVTASDKTTHVFKIDKIYKQLHKERRRSSKIKLKDAKIKETRIKDAEIKESKIKASDSKDIKRASVKSAEIIVKKKKKFVPCTKPRYLPGSIDKVILQKDLVSYNKHLYQVRNFDQTKTVQI